MNNAKERKARNNKLEYFLKKNLHPNVYSNIRWYEAVIVRTGSTLDYKQIVVSGEDIYLISEASKRSIAHFLHSSQVTQVQLVHDLPEFLRGGIRDQTTHITIKYRPGNLSSLIKGKTGRLASQRTVSLTGPSTSSIDEENEDTDVEDGGGGSHQQQDSIHISNVESILPSSPILPHPADTTGPQSLHHVSIDSLSTRSDGSYPIPRRKDWPLSPTFLSRSTNSIISSHSDSTHHSLSPKHMLMSPLNGAKSPVRSRSPEMDSGSFEHRSLTPTIADLLSRVSSHGITRSMTPEAVPRSRMPRSISALETYHRSSPLHLDLPSRSKSVLDRPTLPGEPPKRSQSLNFADVTDGRDDVKEVHFYTLSTSTLLFHLLHSLWVASSLKKTLYEGRPKFPLHDILQERDIDMDFSELQSELLSAVTIEDQFSRLQELQQGVAKYSSIRRLFWKDPNMLNTLRTFLKQYSKSCGSSNRAEELDGDELQERQDELEVLALTLETLATCLQGTQRCSFKMKTLQQNRNECLRELISEAMVVPEVPSAHNLTCTRWLTDFRELSSNAWENLPESELLRLVQEVIHTSVSCLYELLASAAELAWVTNPLIQSEEVAPSITTILQHAPVENWLSYSVPQLLVLLQPERSREGSGSDACLIHQYCSVLNTLLHHSPQALHYCTTQYAEELRYYVQESVVSCRLGSSPIRPHTIKLVQTLAQLVLSKNTLRSR